MTVLVNIGQVQAQQKGLVKAFESKIDQIQYLHMRWMDEKEFEDFAEYEKVMKENMPAGYNFIKGTKKPFGCIVENPVTKHRFHVTTRASGRWFVGFVNPGNVKLVA